MKPVENPNIIIDATNAILGRLASFAAKQALLGKTIAIVNCNDAVVSGRRANILKEYQIARARGGSIMKGPNFPHIPERLVKRTIRGMLKYKQQRGADALDRVICYNKLPKEYESSKKTSLEMRKEIKAKTIKLSELGKLI